MSCIYRGESFKACDGNRYVTCYAMQKDILFEECGCASSEPKLYCGFYTEVIKEEEMR